MRKVCVGVSRAAFVVVLFVALAAPALHANEYQPEPPEARMKPPVGSQSYEPGSFGLLVWWIQVYSGLSIALP